MKRAKNLKGCVNRLENRAYTRNGTHYLHDDIDFMLLKEFALSKEEDEMPGLRDVNERSKFDKTIDKINDITLTALVILTPVLIIYVLWRIL